METSSRKALVELPSELLLRTLSHLPHSELYNCILACKILSEIGNDSSIWRNLLNRRRKHDSIGIGPSANFKKLFRVSLAVNNLRKGRFIYRTLSKAYISQKGNTLKFNQYTYLSPRTGVINRTLVPRWNDSYPQVEARSIMDINTLNITELKSKQFENMHVIFSCGYFIALKIGRYGPDSRQLFVYKADPDNLTNVPSDPITVLEFPSRTSTSYDAHILSHRYLMHRETVDIGVGNSSMVVYDLQQSVTVPLAKFSFEGYVLFLNKEYVVTARRGFPTELYILEWRKASGKIDPESMIKIESDAKVYDAAVSGDRLLLYKYNDSDIVDSLALYDLKTKKLLLTMEGEDILPDSKISCFHGDFCFLIGLDRTIALDLSTGAVIQRISIGEIISIEPILDEDGLCGKFYIVGALTRGILDLSSPLINRKFQVIVLPAVHSIKAAMDNIQRVEVVYGDLSKIFPELCKTEPRHVESQVLLVKEKQFRYILVFNCKGEKKEETSRIVKKLLLRAMKLPHNDNCPIHCVTLDWVADAFDERLDGEGGNILQALRGYGPSILMYEEWSESDGWIPTNVPNSFDLKKLKKQMK